MFGGESPEVMSLEHRPVVKGPVPRCACHSYGWEPATNRRVTVIKSDDRSSIEHLIRRASQVGSKASRHLACAEEERTDEY